jgi:hypothetical protein
MPLWPNEGVRETTMQDIGPEVLGALAQDIANFLAQAEIAPEEIDIKEYDDQVHMTLKWNKR